MRTHKESIVAGEDVKHFVGALGCAQLVSKSGSYGRLHFVNSVIITVTEKRKSKYLLKLINKQGDINSINR